MKIIDLETLLKQPDGVIFADYIDCGDVGTLRVFGGRQQASSTDYTSAEFSAAWPHLPDGVNTWQMFWMEKMESGAEALIDVECWGRDGSFDEDAMFVLLDKNDVLSLLQRITKSLTNAYDITAEELAAVGVSAVAKPDPWVVPALMFCADGISVADLKRWIAQWPETNKDNEPTMVCIGDTEGTSSPVVEVWALNPEEAAADILLCNKP